MKEFLSSIYRALEDIFEQTVDHGVDGNILCSRFNRFIEFQKYAQNNLSFLMTFPTFPAHNTKLFKTYAEIDVVNKAKFYDPSKDIRKGKEELQPPFTLTGRSLLLPVLYKRDNKKILEKKKISPNLLDLHARSLVRESVAHNTIKSTVTIKMPKVSMCYDLYTLTSPRN